MCENKPEYKKFAHKHIKAVSTKNSMYTPRRKCWCCHTIGHISSSCPCRQAKQLANLSCKSEGDISYDSYESTDSETMHEERPNANACEVIGIDDIQKCKICTNFHENNRLCCGHEVPVMVAEANALQSMSGKILTVPGFVNNVRVRVLCDTGSTLIGVHKSLVQPRDYTGKHIICRTFGGEQQKYPAAWIKNSFSLHFSRVKCAVLPNPCTELIIGNVPNIVEIDETMLQQWKCNNQCDNDVTNAVTRQQTALLCKESDKNTVQLQHINAQVHPQQSTDLSDEHSTE